MPVPALTMDSLTDWLGKELGVSTWKGIEQDRIAQFANCTGDQQWIHVDVERARRESPFGGPVAHGFLTLSMLPAMGMEIGIVPNDAVAVFNYGIDKLRFLAPVKAGARVRCRAVLIEVTDQGSGRKLMKVQNTVEIEGEAKPALVAESLAMVVGRG